MAAAPLRATDPTMLGRYRLEGRLGEGGQGTVFLARGPAGEPLAIKLLHARFSADPAARARFAREIGAARRVAQFCTARVLDADIDGENPYLVSEFVGGPSLQEAVDRDGALTGPPLDRVAIGTITALTAVHEAGIVHRDFKPGNVMLSDEGPRVVDFGIARLLAATRTLTSQTMGTPAYMAPEQFGGDPVGPAADVFAWGCTMSFAANGTPPFGDDSIPAVLHRVLSAEPDLGRLTGRLRDLVASCLAKDPDDRPQAADILLRLLGRPDAVAPLADGSHAATPPLKTTAEAGEHAPRPGRPAERRLWWVAAGAVATVLLAAGIGVGALSAVRYFAVAKPNPSLSPSQNVSPSPSLSPDVSPSLVALVPAAGPIVGLVGKCVNADSSSPENGAAVRLHTCDGSEAQKWTIRADGRLSTLGKCLDVPNSDTTPGTLLHVYPCNGTDAQAWELWSDGSLRNSKSGLCLDVPNGDTADGVQLQIADCNGTSPQHWVLP